MPCSRTGIVVVAAIALLIAGAMVAPRGGTADRSAAQVHADTICDRAVREMSRLPRPAERGQSVALALELARLLRWTAAELRAAGSDDLAWAHQRWAAAIDDVRQALRREQGSARAGATELVARSEAATAARKLGAEGCVRLAGRG